MNSSFRQAFDTGGFAAMHGLVDWVGCDYYILTSI